jgi:hypothetical protein
MYTNMLKWHNSNIFLKLDSKLLLKILFLLSHAGVFYLCTVVFAGVYIKKIAPPPKKKRCRHGKRLKMGRMWKKEK